MGALLLLVCVFSLPGAVYASGISPATGDIEVMQGDSAHHTMTIVNNEDDVISYSVRPIGVELGEVTTDVSFYELPEDIASWVRSSESQFALTPDSEKEIEITVTPPVGTDSKVFVLGIQVVEESNSASGVQVGSGFVSLLFVTIGEGFEEEYEFLAFSSSRSVATELPISFAFTVRNTGERVVQPQGSINVTNMFGKTVETFDVNPSDKRILPNQARTFVTAWDAEPSRFSVGVYRVQLRVAPWIQGEEFMQELTVVYVPKRTVILLSAFAILLILISRYSSVLKRGL